MEANDTQLGTYVYCASHIRPHTSGWCTVPTSQKIGLLAATMDEAFELTRHLGLPVHGYCPVCYKYIANEHPHNIFCPEHSAQEKANAEVRRADLHQYLWGRALDGHAVGR
jgi:hypothetical protein